MRTILNSINDIKLTKYYSTAGSMVSLYKRDLPEFKNIKEAFKFIYDKAKEEGFEFWNDTPYVEEQIYKYRIQIKYDNSR